MKRTIVLSMIVVGLAIVSAADAAIVTSIDHRSDCTVLSRQPATTDVTSIAFDNATNLETSFTYNTTCSTRGAISFAGADAGSTYTAFVSDTSISSSGTGRVESFIASSWNNTASGRARLIVQLTPDTDLIYSIISPSVTASADVFSSASVQLRNLTSATNLYQLSEDGVVGSTDGILLAGVSYQILGSTTASITSIGYGQSLATAYNFTMNLTPVPIPASAPLLATGLAMVLARFRRRRL